MRVRFVLAILGGVLIGFGVSGVTVMRVAQSQEAKDAKPVAESTELETLEASAAEFEKAFNTGDAKAIAAQFTENAEVVDEDGNLVQGRDNIQARFAALFEEFPKAHVDVEVASLRQLSRDVAVEDGFSTTKLSPEEPASRSPYTLVHLKRDGKWRIASVRDFPAEDTATPHDQLQPLEWLVGHWVDENPEGRVETTCQWSDDGNYLLQDYVIKTRRGGVMKGTQRIGWDPLRRTIRSWVFDHSGAFTEATWTLVDGSWFLRVEGVTPDGKSASVTRVVTPISEDSFQIDSTSFLIGTERQPDTSVRVVRRPPEPVK